MDDWIWIALAVAIVVVIVIMAVTMARKRRTDTLREQFGPEYDRALTEQGGRREAETDLRDRVKRHDELDLRPLAPATAERYQRDWRDVQARFVDSPEGALGQADGLITAVMRERGYPMDDFEQRSSDISVDHPDVVQDYRAAHGISMANDQGRATTEDLRQAMVHYRSLFERLVEADESATANQEVSR
jgi:hypothetical protein